MKEIIVSLLNQYLPQTGYLQNKYLISVLLILFFFFLGKLLLIIINGFLQKLAAKTTNKIDDLILDKIKKPVYYLILTFGLEVAFFYLQINSYVTKIINSLMAIVFLLIISRALDILIESWGLAFAKRTRSQIDDVILPLLHKVEKVVFVIIAFLWILKIWEINITPYLAGVGLSGLVLGLALQDSLKNIFGGISLILDKTFRVGDKIKLESGEVGTVHDIGLRSTKLITYDNEVIYIPNGYLANSKVQNYHHPVPRVRVGINFSVEYGTDAQKVKDLILPLIKKMSEVLEDPMPTVDFQEMGDFALKFKAFFWVPHWTRAYPKKLEATELIYKALGKAKIGIPFPTQTIYFRK